MILQLYVDALYKYDFTMKSGVGIFQGAVVGTGDAGSDGAW